MNENKTEVKRALISVSNKDGVLELAKELVKLGVEILSTGGTSKLLREANVPVRDVSDLTGFPEIMDGRVKTLHPKVHGGILGLRDEHEAVAKQHGISWIDLVVVNLYPFAETIKKPNVKFDDAVENIDIGGPTMIRSAAKNMGWVGVVVDPNDYSEVINELKNQKGLTFAARKKLATKAFQHTAEYDALITAYLTRINASRESTGSSNHPTFNASPNDVLSLHLQKFSDLRYGENPHQTASAYTFDNAKGILAAIKHQGKELSYNNIADSDAAVAAVREFSDPACVVVKHANPCGVAVADTIETAFEKAFAADPVSAFGGIVALNRPCTKELAETMAKTFFEVIVAPSFSEDALAVFAKKENLRILQLDLNFTPMQNEFKFIEGGFLMQSRDFDVIKPGDLKLVTERKPTAKEMEELLFAWHVVKHVKSNAILIAKENRTVGIGAGQVSRIDAVELAIKKSNEALSGCVLASDAFFPFRDSIDRIAATGIRAIIQPEGGMRLNEVIAACDEQGIAMVLTAKRCFKH